MPAATSPFPPNTAPIAGDPAAALIAQINRFQKHYGKPEYPLSAGISDEIAAAATGLLHASLTKAIISFPDPMAIEELRSLVSLTSGTKPEWTPGYYVNHHLVQITQTLAGFGDWSQLPPAAVGITTVGPGGLKKKRLWPWALGLAAAVGGLAYLRFATKRVKVLSP